MTETEVGRFSPMVVGQTAVIRIMADPDPSPSIVKVVASGPTSDALYATGGPLDMLMRLGGNVIRVEGKDLLLPWTIENAVIFDQWLTALEAGFAKPTIDNIRANLKVVPLFSAKQGASMVPTQLEAVPPNYMIELTGLEKCHDATWQALKEVPGAFVRPPSGKPMPITGNWAEAYYQVKKVHPSPVYAPAFHIELLSRILPFLAPYKDGIRAAIGLDFPLLPPGTVRFEGFDPKTGKTYQPWKYQLEATSKAVALRRSIMMLPPGSGKSSLALAAADHLFRSGHIDRAIVVCPKSIARTTWQAEILKFFPSYYPRTVLVEGSPKDRAKDYAQARFAKLVVTQHDTWRMPDAQVQLASLLGPRTLVIVDEVHVLKHVDTKKATSIQKLLDGWRWTPNGLVHYPNLVTDYRLFLTGTLVDDRPADVYGPLHLLGFRLYNTEDEFQRLYFHRKLVQTSRTGHNGQPITKQRVISLNPEKTPLLQEVVSGVAFYRRMDELQIYLPPLRIQNMVIEPTGSELQAYRVIKGEVERMATAAEAMAKTGGSSQAYAKVMAAIQESLFAIITMERMFSCDPALIGMSTSMTAVGKLGHPGLHEKIGRSNLFAMSPGSKMQALIAYLGSFLSQPGGKVVIFTSFKETMTVLQALMTTPPHHLTQDEKLALQLIRHSTLFFHGDLTVKQRETTINTFLSNPRFRVLFSTDSGAVGQNLQGAASHVINFDQSLSYGKLRQRIGRVWRQGQTLPVLVINMMFAPEAELDKNIASLTLMLASHRFVDPRVKALLAGKELQEKELLDGL